MSGGGLSSETLRALVEKAEPPQRFIDTAVELSTMSPCRSKRGVVIFRENLRIASGYNFKPRGFDCDGTEACKATCRAEAVHAEQMALLKAGLHAQQCDLLHVKSVGGQLVPSGGPSCVQCSKLALASGIAGVWLFHSDGWRRYEIAEFHQLSLLAVIAVPQQMKPIRAHVEGCRKALSVPVDLCACGGRDFLPDGAVPQQEDPQKGDER